MSYLNSWVAWLVVIFIILIVMCVWIRATTEEEQTSTTSKTSKTSTTSTTSKTGTSKTKSTVKSNVPANVSDIVKDMRLAPVLSREIQVLSLQSPRIDVAHTTQTDASQTFTPKAYVYGPKKNTKMQSKGEQACKIALDEIYNKDFQVQVRNLPWLKNPKTKRNLELDLYCPELKIACEYHGKQHYQIVNRFHPKGQDDLDYQKWKDQLKVDLCDDNGVYLITVPYTIPLSQIKEFILHYLPERENERLMGIMSMSISPTQYNTLTGRY